MKAFVSVISLLVFLSNLTIGQYGSLVFDNIERTYLVHLPSDFDDQTPLPLIVAMHGGFGSADNLQTQSGLSDKADVENFIVVYPEGVESAVLNIRTWNAGVCCGYASNQNIDDVGFINALLDKLLTELPIDEDKIFATGMSNGGFMSYRLACDIPDRFTAIAPVACSMTMPNCNPERPIPIIHFHSFLDENIPFNGGPGNGASTHYNPPIDSILHNWSGFNDCNMAKDTVTQNSEFTYVTWRNCECKSIIDYYISEDGGHSWPGGVKTLIGDETSEYIHATDLMWDFFKDKTKECISNTKNIESEEIRLFPNPAIENIYIKTPLPNPQFKIYDLTGNIRMTSTLPELRLKGLQSGVYVISITSGTKSVFQKFIIQN